MGSVYRSTLRKVNLPTISANLKLEVALSHCDAHRPTTSRDIVHALFADLPPNANHQAIAQLHRGNWAKWVITTNFDGAIEATGAFAGRCLPISLGIKDHAVLKLHGDADSGDDIVATMNRLVERRNFALIGGMFAALQGLGMNRLLLVGYSGRGDIDVLPELRAAQARGLQIWWSVLKGKHAPSDIPVAGVIEHDLFDDRDNVLLQLAGINSALLGRDEHATLERAVERLRPLVEQFTEDELIRIPVALLLEANFGWQPAKLLFAAERLLQQENNEQWSFACERMSAYASAVRHLRVTAEGATGSERAATIAREGFLLQEAGRTAAARRRFDEARREVALSSSTTTTFRQSDFIWRGWLESEIERACAMWNANSRRAVLIPLRDRCAQMQAAAEHNDPAVAAILHLRLAQVNFVIARSRSERAKALRQVALALTESIDVQHADGEAVARRFLSAVGGRQGKALLRSIDASAERTTQRPAREVFKRIPNTVQAWLPPVLLPWKLQLPFIGLIKMTTSALLDLRLRLRLVMWRIELGVGRRP